MRRESRIGREGNTHETLHFKPDYSTGNGSPGIISSWSMQEILAKGIGPSCGAPPLTSPTSRGELSRRLPSDWDVQNNFPVRNGLVGNSRMWLFPTPFWSPAFLSPAPNGTGGGKLTGLRKTSKTFPCLVTNATAFRSLASTQIFPNTSRAMPSPPSRIG